jgi:hypothetical protein
LALACRTFSYMYIPPSVGDIKIVMFLLFQ